MESIKMSFVSLQRILDIASRSGGVDGFEENTLVYLIKQCNQEQQDFLVLKYGRELDFIKRL